MATYGIPLSWDDPTFNGVTDLGVTEIPDGGSLSYASITEDGPIASVVGDGSFTLDHVRINSDEGVRVGGSGSMNISNSFIETTGLPGDHADGLQAYDPGGTGDITITNTTIVSHDDDATGGVWIADSYSGSLTLNNVIFEGGPYGLRVAADAQDIYVSLTNVYFVGPFAFAPFLFQNVGADVQITHWENVHYATIVNGQLVPGALIPPPEPLGGVGGSDIIAVAVMWSMYGAVGSLAEITNLATAFLTQQIAFGLHQGFNPGVYASEALGLALALDNANGGNAFANLFGPENVQTPNTPAGDAAFAAAAASTIFASSSTTSLINAVDGFVANWKSFYNSNGLPNNAHPTSSQVDLAARGAAWGDAVGLALANDVGPLLAFATNFLENTLNATAGTSSVLENVQVTGVAQHLDQATI